MSWKRIEKLIYQVAVILAILFAGLIIGIILGFYFGNSQPIKEFIKEYDVAQVIFTIILIGITAYYAYSADKLSRKEPYFYAELSGGFNLPDNVTVRLYLPNIGDGIANDVQINIPDLDYSHKIVSSISPRAHGPSGNTYDVINTTLKKYKDAFKDKAVSIHLEYINDKRKKLEQNLKSELFNPLNFEEWCKQYAKMIIITNRKTEGKPYDDISNPAKQDKIKDEIEEVLKENGLVD